MHTRLASILTAGAAAAFALSAGAETFTWSGGASTLASPKELACDANWEGGKFPNSATAAANVTSAGTGAYFTLTNANMTLGTLKAGTSSKDTGNIRIVGDKTLTLNDNTTGWDIRFYTPLHIAKASGDFYFNTFYICDDLTAKNIILANVSSIYFQDNYWAKSGGDIDRTAAKIPQALEYYGSF